MAQSLRSPTLNTTCEVNQLALCADLQPCDICIYVLTLETIIDGSTGIMAKARQHQAN